MSVATATIRPMRRVDVAPSSDLLRAGDFGDREAFFAWAVDQPTLAPFVAERAGRIVGTAVASAHGNAGWVGVIFVAADERGRGLGRQLTRTVIAELEGRGCRSLILIASPLGRPIYESEGFVALDRQIRFSTRPLAADSAPDDRLRPYADRDLDAVLALDRYATGEDRGALLRVLLDHNSTTIATDASGAVRGYLTRGPWRGGALIAPDPDDALRLLDHRRRTTAPGGLVGTGLVEGNHAGRERLRAAGWVEERGNVRMIRGEALDWHPDAIWGQLNGALG
jgi:GNAT superfamily N-acetyltransferase